MTVIDINKIQKILPHRYPFLMIDKVIDLDPGKTLTAVKNVTINEPFFSGHFPHQAVFPGVLMLECIAQASAILASIMIDAEASQTHSYLFAGIDKARFKRPVGPGDQLRIKIEFEKCVKQMWRCSGKITVDEELACYADVLFTHREIT